MVLLSTNEAAKILGVSGATVRNWHRVGHLACATRRPLLFDETTVRELLKRIHTNQFSRLRKRANKTAGGHVPIAAIDNEHIPETVARLNAKLETLRLDPEPVLFMAALRYLEKKGEVSSSGPAGIAATPLEELAWRRSTVGKIMLGWHRRFEQSAPVEILDEIDHYLDLDCRDRLGVLKQALATSGHKSLTGAFLTPWKIIDDALEGLGRRPENLLDPCCGTGRYLIRAVERFRLDPSSIFGFDFDPVAVDIARLNLLLSFPGIDFVPRIRCLDSLRDLANGELDCDTNHLIETVDAVATNPPWGGCKNLTRHKNLTALIKSGESFSLFLEKAIRLLRKGGRLSFILPESMLHIKAHSDIRRHILERSTIMRISLLGKVFADVFTPIMRLDLEKAEAPANWMVAVHRGDSLHHAPQKRFHANTGHSFDVSVTPDDEMLLEKIYRVPHKTLRRHADWAVGIVTGDNAKYVLHSPEPGTEPVLRGRDIFRYSTRPPTCFIKFQPGRFQQVAPEKYYRAPEKLMYRFVSDQLIFAYDNKGILTLNSANVLIPSIPGLSIKSALAFLNSSVFQYIFTKRFNTRKILRGDLESMPFPDLSPELAKAIESKVEECMGGDYQPAQELDSLVSRAFSLDDADVLEIKERLSHETGAAAI